MAASEAPIPMTDDGIRCLTDLRPGDRGRLVDTELAASDRDLLQALGFGYRREFRLCQAGSPWIVQVRGTRIGLADEVARRLRVVSPLDAR